MRVAGIDLAARERNPTGICVVDGGVTCRTVRDDWEILRGVGLSDVVAIDAPLTEGEPFRDGERELIHMGFRPLPTNMGSIRELRERAMRIAEALRGGGATVIETFPGAFRHPLLDVKVVRRRLGIRNRHERDALLCAIVAYAYAHGKAKRLGRAAPIYIVESEYVEKWIRERAGV